MNYDGSQQYGFNLGLAAAAAAAAAAASQQQPVQQNVAGNIYPYFPGAGDLQQQQQLSAKVAALGQPTAVAALARKNILYSPQQHHLQQQQQHLQHQQPLQQQQHGTAFGLVQGQAMVGRQNVFPMATGLSIPQEPLCSPQNMLEAYGSLSPNMMGQKVASTGAVAASGYRNFGWMNIPQANNNIATVSNNNNAGTTTPVNNQPSLPSIGHLLSHLQQQQKQQTTMTALFHPSPQQSQPQQHQQNIANFQSIHVFQGAPTANLQMSPGGLQVSPGSIQVSPNGQAFQVPQSLQNTLSPNTMAAAGVGFSALRQVQVSAAIGGMVGGGIRNQVVMAPRGQVIMAQTFPTGNSGSNEMKNFQSVAKLATVGPGGGLGVRAVMGGQVNVVSAPPISATLPSAALVTSSTAVSHSDQPVSFVSQASCNHIALTTTTVTVTTSACSLAATTATTVHTSIPLATSITTLPNISPTSCQHTSPHPSHPAHNSHVQEVETKREGVSGLSATSSMALVASSAGTPANGSDEAGNGEVQVIKVPYSWRRELVNGAVVYFSPSNVCLSSLEQIQAYLSKSGTCKCGLECPLQVGRTFNFDPAVEGKPWSMEDVTCSQDLTKLCNHKRKVLALAAFQNSTVGQETQGKADGPATKFRKRDKGKLGDNLLVSPLVADSKLKTSITNAVNKHAAATALSLSSSHNSLNSSTSSIISSAQSSSAEEIGVAGSISQATSTDLGISVPTPQHMVPPSANCGVDRSGSIHCPAQSPMSHSPASMHSTPGMPVGGGGDHMEGLGPITSHFPGKLDFGRNHSCSSVAIGIGGRGMTPNHVDPRQFPQSALQCNVFSPDEFKQSYFMQQPQVHPHPQGQVNMSGMPFMAPMPPHTGVAPAGTQTFRGTHPISIQMQYPVGFPHGQQQVHSQHHYPNTMVCHGLQQQQQQHMHPTHQHSQQQPPPLPHHHAHQGQSLLRHHQPLQPPHTMFQNLRMGSPGVWPPQHLPPHHGGPTPPSGYLSDPHHQQGGGVFPGGYPHMGDLLWLEPGKPKSKRPRSKKDKQKLNSIVDRTSPCGVLGRHRPGGAGTAMPMTDLPKCSTPSTPAITTSTPNVFPSAAATTTLPCSVSFLENPAVFVAQQTAIINSSLASCQVDLGSPPHLTNPTFTSNPVRANACSATNTTLPIIKVEPDCDERLSESFPASGRGMTECECKQEPTTDDVLCLRDQDKKLCGNSSIMSTVHLNKSHVVSKLEPSAVLPSQSGSSSSKVSDTCGTGGNGLSQGSQGKKKPSPKAKNRQKMLPVASKLTVANTCLPECASPVTLPQHSIVSPQLPVHHQQHTSDANAMNAVTGSVPFQVPDLSQLLLGSCGNTSNNWNLMALQLAQYNNSNGNNGSLGGNGDLNSSASTNAPTDFPASSLLTAAARAQLSQQTPLNSFLLPAILSANGLATQDLPLLAAAALQQQQQQQLQQHDATASVTLNGGGSADLTAKTSPAMAGTSMVGVSPVGVATLNQACSLPMQLLQGTNMVTAGVMPTTAFQGGTLLAQGVQSMQGLQGLPLNVFLPMNQTGVGADGLQGISIDMAGNILASVSMGNTVCKTLNISPKMVTTLVDTASAISPGSLPGSLSPAVPTSAGFSSQGCGSMKGMGSTIHHLPQNNIPHAVAQNIGSGIQTQNLSQSIQGSQNTSQSMQGQAFNQTIGQGVPQALGVNVSMGLGGGEAVVLNSLLPSFLTLNTSMPPISLPMVTSVTNSLAQVIPAVATAPALLTTQQQHQPQHQQPQQQQASAAQFLNSLAIPAVAAAAFANPLLITNPLVAQATANPPVPQYPTKVITDERDCDESVQSMQAMGSQIEEKALESSSHKLEDGGGCSGKTLDMSQHHSLSQQALTVQTSDAFQQQQQQQQVFVLPGGGLPLMHVLSAGTHQLGAAAGVVDKLCNTTQLFLPAAPSAATLSPDLTQLGAVAALTPLGIQQMWNSLNSLQLQQLQTLQLQQLVWQQLQGMQALPPHITTLDASATHPLQTHFFTNLQQQQVQISTSQQQPQQSQDVLIAQEEEVEEEEEEMEAGGLISMDGAGSDCGAQTEIASSCISMEKVQARECVDASPASPVQSPDASNSPSSKAGPVPAKMSGQSPDNSNGFRESKASQEILPSSDISPSLQQGGKSTHGGAERNTVGNALQKPDIFLNCMVKSSSGPASRMSTASSPRLQSIKSHVVSSTAQSTMMDTSCLSGKQSCGDPVSLNDRNARASKTLYPGDKTASNFNHSSYHPTVNGNCRGKNLQSQMEGGGKRRGVKRSLEDQCLSAGAAKVISNGTAALPLGGMPVVTITPGPNIVGQGQCST